MSSVEGKRNVAFLFGLLLPILWPLIPPRLGLKGKRQPSTAVSWESRPDILLDGRVGGGGGRGIGMASDQGVQSSPRSRHRGRWHSCG